MGGKDVKNLGFFFIHSRDFMSQQGGNVMIADYVLSALFVIATCLLLWEAESLVSVFMIAAHISFPQYI